MPSAPSSFPRANNLFKMVHDGRNLRGRANDAVASACMYIACRQEGVPRTFKEIVAVSTVSKKEIGRCFKLILKAHDTSVELITTGDFMSRFCGMLNLARDVQKAATHIAKQASDMDITPGRSPISVAAAAIYMASQASSDRKTGREIAEVKEWSVSQDTGYLCSGGRGGGGHHQAELQAHAVQGHRALPHRLQVIGPAL